MFNDKEEDFIDPNKEIPASKWMFHSVPSLNAEELNNKLDWIARLLLISIDASPTVFKKFRERVIFKR